MSNIPVVSPSVNQILIGQQPQVDQSQLTTPMIGTPVINQNLINCQFQVTDQSQMALQQTGVAAALGQNLIGQAQTVNQLPMVIPQQYQYTPQPQLLASQNMLIGNQQGGMLLDQLGLSTSSVVPGMLLGQQGVSPSVVMPGVSVPAMMPGASPSPLMPGISLALPGLSQSPLLPGLPVGQPGVSLSAMMPGISLGQPGVSTQSLMPGMPLGQPGMSPSALMLPNGQIIPVVTQPELLFPSITPLVSSKGETTAVYQNVVSAVTTTSDVPPQQQSKKATPTRPILPKPAQGCPQAAPVAPVTGGLIVAQNVVAPSVINQNGTFACYKSDSESATITMVTEQFSTSLATQGNPAGYENGQEQVTGSSETPVEDEQAPGTYSTGENLTQDYVEPSGEELYEEGVQTEEVDLNSTYHDPNSAPDETSSTYNDPGIAHDESNGALDDPDSICDPANDDTGSIHDGPNRTYDDPGSIHSEPNSVHDDQTSMYEDPNIMYYEPNNDTSLNQDEPNSVQDDLESVSANPDPNVDDPGENPNETNNVSDQIITHENGHSCYHHDNNPVTASEELSNMDNEQDDVCNEPDDTREDLNNVEDDPDRTYDFLDTADSHSHNIHLDAVSACNDPNSTNSDPDSGHEVPSCSNHEPPSVCNNPDSSHADSSRMCNVPNADCHDLNTAHDDPHYVSTNDPGSTQSGVNTVDNSKDCVVLNVKKPKKRKAKSNNQKRSTKQKKKADSDQRNELANSSKMKSEKLTRSQCVQTHSGHRVARNVSRKNKGFIVNPSSDSRKENPQPLHVEFEYRTVNKVASSNPQQRDGEDAATDAGCHGSQMECDQMNSEGGHVEEFVFQGSQKVINLRVSYRARCNPGKNQSVSHENPSQPASRQSETNSGDIIDEGWHSPHHSSNEDTSSESLNHEIDNSSPESDDEALVSLENKSIGFRPIRKAEQQSVLKNQKPKTKKSSDHDKVHCNVVVTRSKGINLMLTIVKDLRISLNRKLCESYLLQKKCHKHQKKVKKTLKRKYLASSGSKDLRVSLSRDICKNYLLRNKKKY